MEITLLEYKNIYEQWANSPEEYWKDAARDIDWIKFPEVTLNSSNAPFYSWFDDGLVNTCYNAVDRHVLDGMGKNIAIIYDSPVTGVKRKISYKELLDSINKLAAALNSKGIVKGDRVIIYMPMIPEALISMLAVARIGAIHSVVFGGFAANELAVRIDDCKPKAILAGSCGIEPTRIVEYKPLLDGAISLASHKPEFCVIFQRDECLAELNSEQDYDWVEFQKGFKEIEPVPVGGMDPVYILYTSGTTGQPKGVVRPTGGHLVSLAWGMKYHYDIKKGDVFWAASDVGWVVGHSYIVYAPLIMGCTSVLFEGKPVGTPDPGTFWRIISEHQVKSLFTAPTAFRAIKREDPEGKFIRKYELSCLNSLFLAGERADPDTVFWAQKMLKVPVIDHWWQTETGSVIVGNPLGIEALEVKVGSPSVPMPGYEIAILDEKGNKVKRGELGAIAIKLPLPPGTLPTLWNADDRFLQSYLETFPGYYETGDAGMIDNDGYVYIMARTDDVINVAGHRLSTGAMEEVLATHKDVAECAVIGVPDQLKGEVPLGFICLNSGVNRDPKLIEKEVVQLVREKIGPVAAFKTAVEVKRLPKTRSGKILRSTMVKVANSETFKVPATIDDKAILDEIHAALSHYGYAKTKNF